MSEQTEERLHAGGYRSTPQRHLVYDAVAYLHHATPEEVLVHVHRTSPGVNLSTVYRVLEVLTDVGLVTHAHIGSGSPTYHVADAPGHIHFICDSCGGVESLPADVARGFDKKVRARLGFEPDITHAGIHGRCARCAIPVAPVPMHEDEDGA